MSKYFALKDFGPTKQILSVEISRDRAAKRLYLSQEKCIEKILQRFNMDNAKSVRTLLATNFKSSIKQYFTTNATKK